MLSAKFLAFPFPKTIGNLGLDVGVADFVQNLINYERHTGGIHSPEAHIYGLDPDVDIGALNVARRSNQYDPVGVIFDYTDVNHDGTINKLDFGTFMRSV